MTGKKSAARKPAEQVKAKKKKPVSGKGEKKNPAQCVFDLYNLKFGMKKAAVEELFAVGAEGFLQEEQLLHARAKTIQLFFDHEDRLWQVKASYLLGGPEEAEALLERMSKDYRFQTPDRKSTRLNSSHGYISYALFCLKKNIELRTPYLKAPRHDPPSPLRVATYFY